MKTAISRRSNGGRNPFKFSRCDEVMFQLVGVDREKLCDLWPDAPFLNIKKSSVDDSSKNGDVSERERNTDVSDVDVDDVANVVESEGKTVGRVNESERLLNILRRKKILKLSRQNKLLALQLEIAEIDLAERRAHASDFERHFLRHIRKSL